MTEFTLRMTALISAATWRSWRMPTMNTLGGEAADEGREGESRKGAGEARGEKEVERARGARQHRRKKEI
eukprot:8275523-Pyramimonas_sp.AAC.1